MTNHIAHALSEPAISVTIPLYNKASHIRRAVQSVLDQTVDYFELIVVDDGSTDGGADVVKSMIDPRIRIISQANAGVSAARNRGIRESQAELIAFLDADDEWKPTFLETVLRLARQFPQCGAFGTAWEMVEANGRKSAPRYSALPDSPWEGMIPDYFPCLLGRNAPLWTSAIAIPRTTFQVTGLFAEGERLAQDQEMWFRIALKFPIAFSTRTEAVYWMNAENRSCLKAPPPKIVRLITTVENAIENHAYPDVVDVNYLVEYRNKEVIGYAAACIGADRRVMARRHLRKVSSTRLFVWRWRLWYLLSLVPYPCFVLLRRLFRFIFGGRPSKVAAAR